MIHAVPSRHAKLCELSWVQLLCALYYDSVASKDLARQVQDMPRDYCLTPEVNASTATAVVSQPGAPKSKASKTGNDFLN